MTQEENMKQEENSTSLITVDAAAGTQMTLQRTCSTEYQTSSGQKVFPKILTGSQKILFPTSVDANTCFEYRFSVKNLMLPSELPNVTDMYFHYLTVKFQDAFTNVMSNEAIKGGVMYTYDPYSAVICQDPNGLEYVTNNIITQNGQEVPRKFINSERVIKRDDNSLYVVSSNLKIEKQINLTTTTSPYRILIMYNRYSQDGTFEGKVLKSAVSCTRTDLAQAIYGVPEEERVGLVCEDIILCDVLIFMMKTCALSGILIDNVTAENLRSAQKKRSLPMNWMSPEEKLEKYGKKGVYMDTYVANKNTVKGSSKYDEIPNNLFLHVDMQDVCSRIFSIARPNNTVFDDVNGIIIGNGIRGQYAIASEMISVSIKSDN